MKTSTRGFRDKRPGETGARGFMVEKAEKETETETWSVFVGRFDLRNVL